MYKFIDIFCNIMIVLLIIYIIVTLVMNGMFSKSRIEEFTGETIKSFEELNHAQVIVDQYINTYVESEYQNFESLLDKSILKNENTYDKIKNNINNNSVFISDVKKANSNNYLIEYNINGTEKENMLVRLDENNMTYIIYYDSMLEKY